jgi:hypothetical protein
MAETRSKGFIHLIEDPEPIFGGRVLPTFLEVLRVYFHRHQTEGMQQKDAVKTVVTEVSEIWSKAKVPISEERNIVRKFEGLLDRYRNICRNKKRKGAAQHEKEADFLHSINLLFDIAHHDAMNMIKIEEDQLFLNDQRSERKYVMAGVDKDSEETEKKKWIRMQTAAERKMKEEKRKQRLAETVQLESSSSESNVESSDVESIVYEDGKSTRGTVDNGPLTSKSLTKRPKLVAIPPVIASALDRTNISDRKAAYILTAAAQTYSMHDDAVKLPLSFSSIRRSRSQHRTEHSAAVKATFAQDGPLVVHLDGKLLPAISSGPQKEDRLAVLVSGYKMEKLLGIPKVSQGTGEEISKVALRTILDWNIQEQVIAMSFDTTAANTGRLNGSCTLLEQKLDKMLLWLACRHHVLEVLCGDVFKSLFGTASGPNVSLFKRFQECWPNIDQSAYKPCTEIRVRDDLEILNNDVINFLVELLNGKAEKLPREDYKELLELTLIFLGQTPPRGIHFRVPGAFHHARWMSKLLYAFKIILFQSQFKLTKHESNACLEFCLFIALVYVRAWITCSSPCDAPINDITLIQNLTNYKNVSEVNLQNRTRRDWSALVVPGSRNGATSVLL